MHENDGTTDADDYNDDVLLNTDTRRKCSCPTKRKRRMNENLTIQVYDAQFMQISPTEKYNLYKTFTPGTSMCASLYGWMAGCSCLIFFVYCFLFAFL